MWTFIIGVLLLAAAIILLLIWAKRISDLSELQQKTREDLRDEALQTYDKELRSLQNKITSLQQMSRQLDQSIDAKVTYNRDLHKIREEEIAREVATIRDERFKQLDLEQARKIDNQRHEVEKVRESLYAALQEEYDKSVADYSEKKAALQQDIATIELVLENFRAKQNAVNEEIMRRRQVEEQEDFYRIILDEDAKHDIAYLLSIVDRFNHKEAIYKIIWSEYLQKPFKLTLNRVLGNKEPRNVIYMIRNKDTDEVYIGKTSAEVSKRWTEHIKSSLSIGTISGAHIHKALFGNWDKFLFSIIEEVDENTSLNEREKYYIDFYQSNIYGYNIKSGG